MRTYSIAFIFSLIFATLNLSAENKGYLILGGGSAPSRNQVSIEYNFKFFKRSMDKLGYGKPSDALPHMEFLTPLVLAKSPNESLKAR